MPIAFCRGLSHTPPEAMTTRSLLLLASIILHTVPSAAGQVREEQRLPELQRVAEPVTDRFLFVSDRTGNQEIYSWVDGEVTQITDDDSYDSWWPRRSPDGTRIAFYRTRVRDRRGVGGANSNYDDAALWMMRADGSGLREVLPKGAYGSKAQGTVDWSPDSRSLVMAGRVPADGNLWHIYITDADGGDPRRVTNRRSLHADPSFSPDGQRIVYTAFPKGYVGFDVRKLEIHTINVDGTDERRLTRDNFRDHDPYWSPDGREIVFETQTQPLYWIVGKWALRTVRPDGTGLRDLLNDGHASTVPRWSPDGQTIYFYRLEFRQRNKTHIARIRRDGTGLQRVTEATREYVNIEPDPY